MPPVGPLRKDDGPACRVCGCTEHNACVTIECWPHPAVACSWVETSGNDEPRDLCSACSGTEADLAEAIKRAVATLDKRTHPAIDKATAIGRAALMRRHHRSGPHKRGAPAS